MAAARGNAQGAAAGSAVAATRTGGGLLRWGAKKESNEASRARFIAGGATHAARAAIAATCSTTLASV